MARTKAKRVASSSSEDDYDRSTQSSQTSPVPNSRKTARVSHPGSGPAAGLDKENSFTEAEADMPPSHAPGTVKKPLYTHNRGPEDSGNTPTKRRLSSRADHMRRQSFANLRFLEPSSSSLSIDAQAAGPSSSSDAGQQQQQQAQQSKQSHNSGSGGGRIAGLAAVRGRASLGGNSNSLIGGDGSPAVSRQAMNENYEEWMKMATDNKINATNTWNFALIDYFHDMSLLRNIDGDGSINFQKASCTLDGCVKIWTSRVDSTATAVGKLMSGLAEEHSGNGQVDEDDAEDGNEEGSNPTRRKRTKRATATLADDFSKIQQKQLDLEFTVDPLFRKTCADFDEGGASGILMNHLGCDRDMRVVFDAGDSKMDEPGEDEDSDNEEGHTSAAGKGPPLRVDVGKLLASHLPDLDVLDDMVICPTLANFKFSSDDSALDLDFFKPQPNDRELSHISDSDAGFGFDAGAGGEAADGQEDFFADELGDAGGADFGQDDAGEDFFEAGAEPEEEGEGEEQGYYIQPQPRQGQAGDDGTTTTTVAMAENSKQQGVFDYFDAAFSKNWAGPEHWKMRRAPTTQRKDEDANAAATTATRQRKVKEPFVIDFESPSTVKAAELFAKPKARAPATVLKSMPAQDGNSYLLPDDMHFSSASLLRLFLKPKAMINMRRRNKAGGGASVSAAPAAQGAGGIDQEIDSDYWAQAAQDAGGADFDAGGEDMDDPDGAAAIPFSTQFLNDDEDDDDDMDMDVGGVDATEPAEDQVEDDLLAATQGQKAKRARPEYVSFAKRAKRVDVKRLKENIWKELAIEVPEEALENSMLEDTEDLPKSFTKVLEGLRKSYPKDKMDEISTSFCFICLLHLANENNLSIKPPKTEAELEAVRRRGRGSPAEEEDEAGMKEAISSLMALEILKDTTL